MALWALKAKSLMKTVYYPTASGPAEAVYGFYMDHSPGIPKVVIVACGDALWNIDVGRDSILNRVMNHELFGVRVDFVRFVAVVNHTSSKPHGKEFKILADLKEFKKRGNPVKKEGIFSKKEIYHSVHIVGGSTRFYTEFELGTLLSQEETIHMMEMAGLV